MRDYQSLRYRHFCFLVYRFGCHVALLLQNIGFYRLSDFVYVLMPLRICKIGYDVWAGSYPDDFANYLREARHE